MSEIWLINGEPADGYPADNRGLAYGDGLFETMRLQRGHLPLLGYHRARLLHGCERLGIQLVPGQLDAWIDAAVKSVDADQAVVKLICVRQGRARGYGTVVDAGDILIRVTPLTFNAGPDQLRARICNQRLARQPSLAGIKHLSRLEQVMAARELAPGEDEGLMLDTEDNLIEALTSNLVFVSGNRLIFADLSNSGVAGVMQSYVRDQAEALGLVAETARVKLAQLADFDEILLTNALRGVRNLESIEGHWQGRSTRVGSRLRADLQTRFPGFQSF